MTLFRSTLVTLFACLSFLTAAQAESVDEMTQKVCVKIKLCGTEEIQKQGLAPEMEQMMSLMFDSMCTSVVAPYVNQTKDAGLESMANACMSSIESMNCDKLIDGGADNSQACIAFEKAAQEAGIDTNTTTIIQ
ncbi:MAG: hypothetical protein ACI9LY_002854 [Arenicella sp.]|jgi:hypothetical protein